MRRTTTLLACGAAIVSLALTGCQKSEAGSPSTPGAAANNQNGGDAVGSLTNLADLVAKKSTEKQSAHVKMNIGAGSESIQAEGDMRFGDSPAIELTMAIPEMTTMTMRLVDGVFYIKLPQELQPGKPWIKIDTNGSDPISKSLGAAVEQMKTQGNPAETLKQLEKAGEIKSSKKEQLNGEQTTHYQVIVDVKKAIAAQSDPDMKKMLEEATKAGLTEYPMDLWLNSDNLPVKMAMNIPTKDPTSGKTVNAEISMEYTDWGKPVTIEAPPASEVGKLPG